MSLKRFRIEQLCPSIDSMISLVFCTLHHYVIVNYLNFHENHVQYVHSKMDDPPRVKQYTVRELSYRKHKNREKAMSNVIPRLPGMTIEQCERAIGMPTTGMSARDVARHFQRHESTISRLPDIFQPTGNVVDRPRSGRPRKTKPREDRFLTTSSRRNIFLSRVCDMTVRNRLHAARLKACRSSVGIPLK